MAKKKKVKQEKLWSVSFFLSDIPPEDAPYLRKKEIRDEIKDISFGVDGLSISLVKISYLGKG